MTLAEQKVASGVKVLDEKVPGWWKVIDLDTLKMDSCTNCMLGQLFGHDIEKAIGARKFNLPLLARDRVEFSIKDQGYFRGCEVLKVVGTDVGCNEITSDSDDEDIEAADFDELKCAWADVIADRRAALPDDLQQEVTE
jgi:hypothetical protein